jgi:hypothetical protein
MRSRFGNFNQRPIAQRFEARVMQARVLFDQGQYITSAQEFEELAALLASRGRPRAGRLYVQAGRGYLHAGYIERGMTLLETGHRILLKNDRTDAIYQISQYLQTELNHLKLPEQAQVVANWLTGLPARPASGVAHPPLPLKCPSCGAPAKPEEVDWLDAVTAECPYCGSPMR